MKCTRFGFSRGKCEYDRVMGCRPCSLIDNSKDSHFMNCHIYFEIYYHEKVRVFPFTLLYPHGLTNVTKVTVS